METIRHNQMKISTEMRNDFDGLLSRLDTDKGRITGLGEGTPRAERDFLYTEATLPF